LRDVVDRFIPGRGLELSASLGTHAPEGRGEAVSMVRALEVPVYLRAEKSLREGMIGVALDPCGAAVLDRDQGRAAIGAVVRAGATHDRGARGFLGGVHGHSCNLAPPGWRKARFAPPVSRRRASRRAAQSR